MPARSSFAALLLLTAVPAAADTPRGSWSVSGEATLVSDYRFRGISLSDRSPAIQGGANLEHRTGFYAGVWGSSIAATEAGAKLELDLMAGYAAEWENGLALDVMAARYIYPSDADAGYFELTGTLSAPLGTSTPRVGIAYAPAQSALAGPTGAEDANLYLFTGIEYAASGLPLKLDAQIGFERGAFDAAEVGGKLDWRIGGSLEAHGATLAIAYVDSDARSPGDRAGNLAGAGIIGSFTLAF